MLVWGTVAPVCADSENAMTYTCLFPVAAAMDTAGDLVRGRGAQLCCVETERARVCRRSNSLWSLTCCARTPTCSPRGSAPTARCARLVAVVVARAVRAADVRPQNLYQGNNLELLKDDLKTKVLLATKDGRKACLAAITALDKTRALKPFEHKAGLNAVSADTAAEMAAGRGKTTTALVLLE